jgi:hypothetical protein
METAPLLSVYILVASFVVLDVLCIELSETDRLDDRSPLSGRGRASGMNDFVWGQSMLLLFMMTPLLSRM